MADTVKRGLGSTTQNLSSLEAGATQNLGVKAAGAACERLVGLLSEQLERGALPEARETVAQLLHLNPEDQDARDIRSFLDEELSAVATGQVGEACRYRGHRTWVNQVAFAPDGRRALSGAGRQFLKGRSAAGDDRSLTLWEVDSGRRLCRIRAHKTAVNCVAFAPDGRRFVSASHGGSICLWDAAFLTVIRQLQRRGKPVWAAAFAPDSRRLLSGSTEKELALWDVRDGRLLRRFEGHTSGVTSIAFAPDGQHALSASFDRTVRLWDVESGGLVRRLDGHAQAVFGVTFTTDGSQALSCSLDRTIRLWDLATGRELRRFQGHTGGVHGVAFSPEGRFVLSGGADHLVRLWDVTTGQELRRFAGHTDTVLSVAFAPDGRHALSASRDRTLRLWQLPGVLDAIEAPTSIFNLVQALVASRILTADQERELTEQLQVQYTEPRALAWYLIERRWVTPYQINQLILGRGQELTLGPYLVLDRLGEGGMGKVLKARHTADKTPAALKVAHPQLMANPLEAAQFWWESQALERLSDPHVVRTFGAFRDARPPFFAMEYLEGNDLEKLVRRSGPLPAALACEYIRQAALGLQHAHEKGLIHRDIKPANLLRTTLPVADGSAGTEPTPLLKVIDWGIADVRLQPGQEGPASPSAPADVFGTPDYMAPEQAATPEATDIRADIYSLGCTLYMLLTGKPPFHGGSFAQKMLKHQQTAPAPIQQHRPDLPDGLPAIVHKMLAKQPEERYQTPAELAVVLTPFSTSKSVRPAGVEQRAQVRYPCKIRASCRLLTSTAEGYWEAEVCDLSKGGLLLMGPRLPKPGAVLAVELELVQGAPCARFARVIHMRPAKTADHWAVGCAVARQFTDDELAALLKGKTTG